MYKIIVYRKHLVQVELDNMEQVDLIRRAFQKMAMIWSDEPMFELSEGMKFGFMAYTTKENIIHTFNYVGISNDPFDPENYKIPQQYNANFVGRLYYERKFVKKKMHRKNYLEQFTTNVIPTWLPINKPQRLTRKKKKSVGSSESKNKTFTKKEDIVSTSVKTEEVHKRTADEVTSIREDIGGLKSRIHLVL